MSATLAEGTVFARRYRVVRLLATGGMGSIHEVVHIETARRRALKAMHAHIFQDEDMRERFRLEARIAANVESEHIVEVFDAGIDEETGIPFLVMELLRGEELGQRVKRLGRLPPGEAITYLYQTALALDRTHAASIVHRDLKPANIFLSEREDGSVRVKLLDFGIAKLIADSTATAGVTRNLGTPIYMAPEQLQLGARLTGAADIYALGMITYTMLVGIPYWRPEARSAGDMVAFAMVAARGPQEPPVQRALAQGVVLPPGFDAWFARATALDPAARFAWATEAVQALGEVLGVPVGGDRRTLPGAPSWPGGMVTAAPPVALTRDMPGPATLPLPAYDAHIPMPWPATFPTPARDGRTQEMALAGTPTGAVVSAGPTTAAKRGRGPLAAGLAVLGLGVLGAGSWLVVGARDGGNPGAAAPAAASEETAASGQTAAALGPTAAAPGPAASAPGSTASAPGSTAAASEPTAVAPEPAASAPGSTASAPGSTASAPGSTAAVPQPAVPLGTVQAATASARPSAPPAAPAKTSAPPRSKPSSTPSATKKPTQRQPLSNSDLYGRR